MPLFVVVTLALPGLLVATTFTEWQAANFTPAQLANPAVSGIVTDPDGDGLSNLAEYIFLGSPLTPDNGLSPRGAVADNHLTLTYRERANLTDGEVWLQASDDLIYWTTFNVLEETGRVTTPGYADITLRDPKIFSSRRFVRLQLALTPVPPLQPPARVTLGVEYNRQVQVSWSDLNVTETGYAVEKFSLISQSWERMGSVPADTINWVDNQLAGYAGSRYRVVSLSSDLEVPSDEVQVTDTLKVGVPDWWQLRYLGRIGGDLNADGVSNYQQYLEGTDPTFNFYQGQPPILTEVSGGQQAGIAGEYLPLPWVIRVTDQAGTPLVNAPVRFSVDQGQLSDDPATTVSGYPSRVVYSDAAGLGRIYWKL